MRVFECDRCKQVNRIPRLRLDVQPCCGKCGVPISDFPLSIPARKAWKYRWGTILFVVLASAAFMAIESTKQPAVLGTAGRPVAPEAGNPSSVRPAPAPIKGQSLRPLRPPPKAVQQSDAVLLVDQRYARDIPLKINTPSGTGGYYIKVLYGGTTQPYMTMFVNSGSSFETNVAPGTFEIAYATGDVWLGSKPGREPFWPADTMRIGKLEGDFTFRGVTGHEITLIKQLNGNLREHPISTEEFGE